MKIWAEEEKNRLLGIKIFIILDGKYPLLAIPRQRISLVHLIQVRLLYRAPRVYQTVGESLIYCI